MLAPIKKLLLPLQLKMTIYPSDFESKIGFNSLRAMVEAKCLSDIGRVIVPI